MTRSEAFLKTMGKYFIRSRPFCVPLNISKKIDLKKKMFRVLHYRGFWPNATFRTWKKSHWLKIALDKFLANERSNKKDSDTIAPEMQQNTNKKEGF